MVEQTVIDEEKKVNPENGLNNPEENIDNMEDIDVVVRPGDKVTDDENKERRGMDLDLEDLNEEKTIEEAMEMWNESLSLYYNIPSSNDSLDKAKQYKESMRPVIFDDNDDKPLISLEMTKLFGCRENGELTNYAGADFFINSSQEENVKPIIVANISSMARGFEKDEENNTIKKKHELGANLFSPFVGLGKHAISMIKDYDHAMDVYNKNIDKDEDKYNKLDENRVLITGEMFPGSAKLFAPKEGNEKGEKTRDDIINMIVAKLEEEAPVENVEVKILVSQSGKHRVEMDKLYKTYDLQKKSESPLVSKAKLMKAWLNKSVAGIPFYIDVKFDFKKEEKNKLTV